MNIRSYALTLIVISISGCGGVRQPPNPQVEEMRKAGRAYYDEKCKSVAGEKIYRTVTGVEGILLMKVRPRTTETLLEDPMWPGAAFALEYTGDSYISSFLGYEHAFGNIDGRRNPITKEHRGYIKPEKGPGARPGYRYVDVIDPKDGLRYRVQSIRRIVGKKDISAHNVKIEVNKNPEYDLNIYRYELTKVLTSQQSPRYGVTFEDYVIPEERAIGVASSTVRVIDLETNEVLGEVIRYAFRPRGVKLTHWLTSERCPNYAMGVDEATRKFVDQVLIPAAD